MMTTTNLLDIPHLFPTGTSPLDDQYQTSRAALAAAEETGKSGEELVEKLLRAANVAYVRDYASRTVLLPDAIRNIGAGFTRCISDAYVPGQRLHGEVKSGTGKETDSLDQKFYTMGMIFIHHGWGDEAPPLSDLRVLDPWKPLHRLMVFVGKKEYSGWLRLLREVTRQFRTGEQPATEAQRDRAHRLHFVNASDMTPRWFDQLRIEIDRYNTTR